MQILSVPTQLSRCRFLGLISLALEYSDNYFSRQRQLEFPSDVVGIR